MSAQLLKFPDVVRRPAPIPPPMGEGDREAVEGASPEVTTPPTRLPALTGDQVAIVHGGEYIVFDSPADLKADVLREAAPSLRAIRRAARAAFAARLRGRRARRWANLAWAFRMFVLLPAVMASAGAVLFVAFGARGL